MNDVGRIGEDISAKYLKRNKFKIIGRNIHLSHNEIDIIAVNRKFGVIAFVEVKTRSTDSDLYSEYGTPASAVTYSKQQRTVSGAKAYLSLNPKYAQLQPRFDVIEVYLSKKDMKLLRINHIENAFGA